MIYTTIQKFVFGKIKKRLPLFDQIYSKNSIILWNIIANESNYVNIFSNVIYSWDAKLNYSSLQSHMIILIILICWFAA